MSSIGASVLIQQDTHLLTVVRDLRQNPVRAHFVDKALKWP